MDEIHGIYHGIVFDNKDPKKLGRVRVLIPGLLEPDPSGWALPCGTMGGGSKQRGEYAVPEVKADVFVMFLRGDPNLPIYLSGNWGEVDGQSEIPSPIASASKDDAPLLRVTETKSFLLVFDERNGSENLLIKEKQGNAFVRFTNGKVELGGTATEAAVLGDILRTKLNTFVDQVNAAMDGLAALTVPTGVGPSGTPVNAATFAAVKSSLVSLKGSFADFLSAIVKVK